jgi:hypothetical protein
MPKQWTPAAILSLVFGILLIPQPWLNVVPVIPDLHLIPRLFISYLGFFFIWLGFQSRK